MAKEISKKIIEKVGGVKDFARGLWGRKIRSKGKGRGLGRGKGMGPIGRMSK